MTPLLAARRSSSLHLRSGLPFLLRRQGGDLCLLFQGHDLPLIDLLLPIDVAAPPPRCRHDLRQDRLHILGIICCKRARELQRRVESRDR